MLDDVQIVKPLTPLAKDAQPEAIVDVFSDVQGAIADARWAQRNVHPHRVPGHAAVSVSLKRTGSPPGDVDADRMLFEKLGITPA